MSIPIDLSADEELAKIEERGTKGRYVSVERLLELGDGRVEWRMATSSTPGGKIPSFVSEASMPGQIAAVRGSFRDHCCIIYFGYRTSRIFSNGSILCARKGVMTRALTILHSFVQPSFVGNLSYALHFLYASSRYLSTRG